MRALSMPISSPSRAESFPPPLMGFLRSSIGSTSRGRSRSSPMFYIRGKTNAEITQEPSSPKVTCIGQVKSRARKSGAAAANRGKRRCWLVKKARFCGQTSSRFFRRIRVCRSVFSRWALFLRSGNCRKSEKRENSVGEREFCSENYGNFTEREFLDNCSSPPKNALILARCRSAPYKSSSLGGRFWTSHDGKSQEFQKIQEIEEENSRIRHGSSEKFEISVKDDEELKGIVGVSVHPLLLTRCKSEPARRGDRLNPGLMD